MKDLPFCLLLALLLMAPVALARDIAPAWVHAQLELRRELRGWVERTLLDRREREPDAELWVPGLGDYWVSGDAELPKSLARELLLLARSPEFEDGYYAGTDGKNLPDAFVPLAVSLGYMLPGRPESRDLVIDAAEHLGNWVSETADGVSVPQWYDWGRHHFRSALLGTRQVMEQPPSGVDFPGNFRFLRLGLAAYLLSGESRYLEWCRDYADEWIRDMRANSWVAPSEITIPTHEVGGFSGSWYRLKLRPEMSWEKAGLDHAEMIFSLADLAAVAGEPAYATALVRQIEVMWNASDSPEPFTFFGPKGWVRVGSQGDEARQAQNDGLLALELLRLRRISGVRSFDERILRWAEYVQGTRPEDALIYMLAHEVSGEDRWLVRGLRLAAKALRDARGTAVESRAAGIGAQVLVASALGGTGVGEGRFPWAEMVFAGLQGALGVPSDVAVVTAREGFKVRCRFYNVGSASEAVTLLPPFRDQRFGRVQTYRAKVLGWPGRGVTVRVLSGYNTWVIAELPQPDDPATWDPPAAAFVEPATPSLRVLTTPAEVEKARQQIRDWFLARARALDRQRWLEWEDLADARERDKYRASIRSRFLRAIGGLPARTPLEPRQAGSIKKPGYRIEKWLIQSRPGFFVPLNLYLPDGLQEPAPGVLVFCGHMPEGKAAPSYQAVCIDLVRQGYVVLIHDPLGQGERGVYYDPSTGNEHFHAGNQCYLLGWNLAQFFVWDAMRAIDFLVSRPEVDPDRIGCTGSSGGGTLTQYVAALDARVRVAAPGCYPCDTLAHMEEFGPEESGEHPENILVGDLEQGIDQFGRSVLISPRPLLVNAAVKDYVPIEGTRLLHRRLLTAYETEEATEALALFEGSGGHGYSRAHRESTVGFFNRWLRNRAAEFESTVQQSDYETGEALACGPGGQVAGLGSETVHSLLKTRASEIQDLDYRAEGVEEVREYQRTTRELIHSLLQIPPDRAGGTVDDRGAFRLVDAVVQKVLLRGEDGIPIPGVVLFREDSLPDAPAVICLGDSGKPGTPGEDAGVLSLFVQNGFTVLAVDPRGMGETRLNDSENYYSWRKGTESSLTYRSFQIGDPLFGQRVRDVLTAVDFVCSGTDQCHRQVAIYGRGNGGLLALTAAAVDPRVAAVAAAGLLASYRSLLDAPEYAVNVSTFIPGVLKAYDVPDLVAAVAPRPVLVANPVDAQGGLVEPDRFRHTYDHCFKVFETVGGPFAHQTVSWEEVARKVSEWFQAELVRK